MREDDSILEEQVCYYRASHVPPGRFESFWRLVDQCLTPGGRVFFVDNRLLPGRGEDERSARLSQWIESRELNDGRRFEIVKSYYEPDELGASLENLGWSGRVAQTTSFFTWGDLRRSADG